jgi:hypothetical protein
LRHFAQIGIAHPSQLQIAPAEQPATVLAYAANSKVVAVATLFTLLLVLRLRKPSALSMKS